MDSRGRAEFAAALLLDLLGAGLALLVATRTWQSARLVRPRPLADTTVHLSGRALDGGPTALAVVALAGVVAVLATRGWARRAVGVVLVVTGVVLVWRSARWFAAVSVARAVQAANHLQGISSIDAHSRVTVQSSWPALSVLAGGFVIVAGAVVAWRGGTWRGLAGRYSAPPPTGSAVDADVERTRADLSLWRALDRGEDPTENEPPAS